MSTARSFFNQKLYYASLLLKALARELELPGARPEVQYEAFGQAVQGHLQDAYGWLLLELAAVDPLPSRPPSNLSILLAEYPQAPPLRGELVELEQLEADPVSWLSELLAATHHGVSPPQKAAQGLLASSFEDSPWTEAGLQDWYQSLQQLGDRLNDGLDEW